MAFSVEMFQPSPGPVAAACEWCCQWAALLSSFLSCSVPAKTLYAFRIVTTYGSVVECIVVDDDELIGMASYHTGSLFAGGHCVVWTSPVFTWFACYSACDSLLWGILQGGLSLLESRLRARARFQWLLISYSMGQSFRALLSHSRELLCDSWRHHCCNDYFSWGPSVWELKYNWLEFSEILNIYDNPKEVNMSRSLDILKSRHFLDV